MKRLLLLAIFAMTFISKSQAQCPYTYTQSGNTVNFTHMWAIAMIYTLDSIRFQYGDATTQLLSFPVGMNSSHVYSGPGTYTCCMTRYLSSLANPGVPIPCTYCDTIVIAGINNCNVTANYSSASSGLNASFTNTTACSNCSSSTYTWDFGDASPTSNLASPSHTYLGAGTYTVCLNVVSYDSMQNMCTDDTCMTVNVSYPPSCFATPGFNYTVTNNSVAYTNSSTCIGCASTIYAWNFGDASPISNVASPTHVYASTGGYNVCLIVYGTATGGQTCSDTLCKSILVSSLGVDDVTGHQLALYPNPAHDKISIDIPHLTSLSTLTLTDMTGREIYMTSLPSSAAGHYEIKLGQASKGVYFVRIRNQQQWYSAKFVKE